MDEPSRQIVAYTRVVRRPEHLYFLVGGDVFERRARRRRSEPIRPAVKVASATFVRQPGWSYFVDDDGNIARYRNEFTLADVEALRAANPHHAKDPVLTAFLEALTREAQPSDEA